MARKLIALQDIILIENAQRIVEPTIVSSLIIIYEMHLHKKGFESLGMVENVGG